MEEEVDQERKLHESDVEWNARKAFLLAHWNDFERDYLLCQSRLFINIRMLGCEYNPPVMERIDVLGAGIMDQAAKLANEAKFVKASEGRKRARELNEKEAVKLQAKKPNLCPTVEEKFSRLKPFLHQAPSKTSIEMLTFATTTAKLSWRVTPDDITRVIIDELLVFEHKFTNVEDRKTAAVDAVVDTLLHGGDYKLDDDSVLFDGVPPKDCYKCFLTRTLSKVKPHLEVSTYKDFKEALERGNLSLFEKSEHLQGWSQKLQLFIGDMLVGERVLSKAEAVRPQLTQVLDAMSAEAARILRGTFEVKNNESNSLALFESSD